MFSITPLYSQQILVFSLRCLRRAAPTHPETSYIRARFQHLTKSRCSHCQIAEVEVDDLGFDLNVEAYFVIGDANGQNHFRANRIGLWSNIWGDEERLFDLEDELGDQFWTNYQIQLLFDEKEQQTI
ncbi:hypothetical protein [Nostoc sp.]